MSSASRTGPCDHEFADGIRHPRGQRAQYHERQHDCPRAEAAAREVRGDALGIGLQLARIPRRQDTELDTELDEDEEELLLLLLLLLDERPIVTRRRGAAFTRLFRGAARLLIHGARLRRPLLPRRLSQRRRPQRRPELLCSLKPQRGLASLQPLQRVQSSPKLLLAIDVARFT